MPTMTSWPGWKSSEIVCALTVRTHDGQFSQTMAKTMSLDRAFHAAHEKALREEEHDQRRRDRQDGTCRDDARRAAERSRQLENADGERHQVALGQHNARPQEVVPRRHGGQDRQCADLRERERQHDTEEDVKLRRAVDARGIEQVLWNLLECSLHHEDADRAGHRGQDYAEVRIDEPELRRGNEVDEEIDLGRQHQRREDDGENELSAAKLVARERVRRERANEDRPDDGPESYPDRIPEIATEIDDAKYLDEVRERNSMRDQRRGEREDIAFGAERDRERPQEGENADEADQKQHRVMQH